MTDIEILRDVDGIAHVRAGSLDDALFGQGWAAAADRCFQLEADRRRATGRWAELVGPGGVASDLLHRRVGIADAARTDLATLAPQTVSHLDAYAAGVNAWLDQADDADLPPELAALDGPRPERWEPWHSLAVYKFRHLLMGTAQTKLWRSAVLRAVGADRARSLWPGLAAGDLGGVDLSAVLAALGGVPTGDAASNNLVLAGTRTASGSPIVAGDPHRTFDLPNVYWQNHLTCPETDVIGLSFPGVPGFPHFGHNAEVAWCITHGMADDQDVYVERCSLDGEDLLVERADGTRRVTTSTETITVAGADPVPCVVADLGDGRRLVAGDPSVGWAVSATWTGTAAADTTADALVPMLMAGSVAELDAALVPWVIPVNNVVMADRAGTIAYRMRGRLARRDERNGWTVVPAWTGEHDWVGFVDDADLPRVVDPDHGYLVTANEDLVAAGVITFDHHVSHDWAHPARGRRITSLLGSRDDWTGAEVLSDVLGDTTSLVAATFVEGLCAVTGVAPLEAAAQASLRAWDHRMDTGAVAPTIYTACRMALLDVVMGALGTDDDRFVGPPLDLTPAEVARSQWTRLIVLAEEGDDALLAGVGGWSGAHRAALRRGVLRLREELGANMDTWTWGRVHTSSMSHPVLGARPDLADRIAVPASRALGGDSETVRCTGVSPPSMGAMRGSVARYVFDLDDWDASTWIVPHGVTGDWRSDHFDDQLDRWAEVAPAPMRFSSTVVDAATESKHTIER